MVILFFVHLGVIDIKGDKYKGIGGFMLGGVVIVGIGLANSRN